jgi:hypothetical protein
MTCSAEGFCEGTCQGLIITPRKEGTTVFTDGGIAGLVIGVLIGGLALGAGALFLFFRYKGDVRAGGRKTVSTNELPPLPTGA